jgi:hypothetical protein
MISPWTSCACHLRPTPMIANLFSSPFSSSSHSFCFLLKNKETVPFQPLTGNDTRYKRIKKNTLALVAPLLHPTNANKTFLLRHLCCLCILAHLIKSVAFLHLLLQTHRKFYLHSSFGTEMNASCPVCNLCVLHAAGRHMQRFCNLNF